MLFVQYTYDLYALNAFSIKDTGGNAAAVMLDSNGVSEESMLKIAAKINFSETAFLRKFSSENYRTRFFTPNKEVSLCGHATIAAFTLLREKNIIPYDKVICQKTLAGMLTVHIEKSTVFMEQALPVFYEHAPCRKEIAPCLNVSEDDIFNNLPIQIVSTGLKDILVPIKNLGSLLSVKPDFELIKKISEKYGTVGIHAFTLDTLHEGTAHCRNFAPLYDIPEESATGTSNGALACYLYRNKIVPLSNNILKFEQGYVMNKPSEIITKIIAADNCIRKILVGGQAFVTELLHITV